MPHKVLELDLTEGLSPIWECEWYDWINILIRYQGAAIGWLSIQNGNWAPVISTERLRYAIGDQLSWEFLWMMVGEKSKNGFSKTENLPSISVVVCTKDRIEYLENCINSLLTLDYPYYEIIVVDAAPSNDDSAKLISRFPVRYVRETRPGLCSARNRGLREARNEIVAFTEDDARTDRLWLRYIGATFNNSDVAAVTGLVVPAELETSPQLAYNFRYGGLQRGFQPKTFQRDLLSKQELLDAKQFGSGVNMAIRRQVFERVGLFDESFDIGAPCDTWGALELLHRLVGQGFTLAYDPRPIVWCVPLRDFFSLQRRVEDFGFGFGRYLLSCRRNRTVGFLPFLKFIMLGWFFRSVLKNILKPRGFSRRLILREFIGVIKSPWAYRSSQAHTKKNLSVQNSTTVG